MNTNLLILAGGASSRMKSSIAVAGLSNVEIAAANTTSKALIGYGKENRPILDFLLFNAEKAGYKNVYLIVGEQSESFKKYYGENPTDNPFGSLSLSYAIQYVPKGREKPYGTSDAVTQAMEQYPHLLTDAFTICNCDNLYSVGALKAMATATALNAFVAYDRDGLEFSAERISRFAIALLDNNNNLVDIIEKPSEENLNGYRDADGKYRVSMNLFKFDGAAMYPYLKNCPPHPLRNEKELPTAVLNFCREQTGQFKGIPFYEHVPDLTSKEDIKVFKKYLGEQYPNL